MLRADEDLKELKIKHYYQNRREKSRAIRRKKRMILSFVTLIVVIAMGLALGGNSTEILSKSTVLKKQGTVTVAPELVGGSEFSNRSTDNNSVTNFAKEFPNEVFFSGPTTNRVVALTFDDGPDTDYTPRILNILRSNDVRATFFLVGQRAKVYPEIVKRIVNDGNAIGNHSWDHADFAKLTPEQVKSEITETNNVLHSIVGYSPSFFRPPYGLLTLTDAKIVVEMKMKVVNWSVDTVDWSGTSPENIVRTVLKEVKPGGIILEHSAGGTRDKLNNTVQVLPRIISELKARGYKFVTIPQLLNI